MSYGRAPVEIMLFLGLGKQEQNERRKANEEATGNAERETHLVDYVSTTTVDRTTLDQMTLDRNYI